MVYGLWFGGCGYGHPYPDQYETFDSVEEAGRCLINRRHNRLIPATPCVEDDCYMEVYLGEPPDGRFCMDHRLILDGKDGWTFAT